jgi:hypothetical protein
MMMPAPDNSVILTARVFTALIFAHALAGKLPNRREFAAIIVQYRMLPEPLAPFVAHAILLAECVTVISLGGGGVRFGAMLACALLCLFALAMSVNLLRGRMNVECGCFGNRLRQTLSPLRLVATLALAVVAALPACGSPAVDSISVLENGLFAGAALFALYLTAQGLAAIASAADRLRNRRL